MALTVDANKILKEIGRQTDRAKVSFYLSKALYKEFRASAGTKPASQVLQRLMQLFIDDTKQTSRKR